MPNRQLQPVLTYVRSLTARGALGRLSDKELLERLATGRDDDAFSVVVERYANLVFGVCRRRLRDVQDAEDACQATFLVLARRAGSIKKREALGTWLHGVAYRVAEQLRRDIARRRGRERPAVDVPQPDNTADISWRELRAVLDEELDRLPARLRAPLVLCYLQGQTRDEAAQQLGWSEGTLRGRLQRARQLLRTRLTRRGVTLPAALMAASLLGVRDAGAAPAIFLVRTLKAITAAGSSAPLADLPGHVVTLTEGVLKTMSIMKAKTAAAVVAVVMLAAGTGTWTYRTLAGPPEPGTNTSAPPVGVTEAAPALSDRHADGAAVHLVGSLKEKGNPAVLTVQFSPDGTCLAAGYADGTVGLWEVATQKRLAIFLPQQTTSVREAAIRALAFAPDGRTLAAGGRDNKVILWDARTGRTRRQLVGQGTVASLAFSPDGKQLAVGSSPTQFRLWVLGGDQPHSPLEKGSNGGGSVAFAPDGQRLATAGPDGHVVLWQVRSGKIFWRVGPANRHVSSKQKPAERREAASVAFSPDGKLLAVAGPNGVVRLLDAATGKEVRRLVSGPQSGLFAVAFGPNGRMLATSSGSGAIRLWDAATGKQIAVLHSQKGDILSLAFAPTGKLLASAGGDGKVLLWQLEKGTFVQPMVQGGQPKGQDRLTQLIHELSNSGRTPEQQIEALYLATLGRFPTETEQEFTKAQLARTSDRARALEEVLDMLTHTREFSSHAQTLALRAIARPAGQKTH